MSDIGRTTSFAKNKKDVFGVLNTAFLCGVALYPLNRLSDIYMRIPVAEVLLFFYALLLIIKSGRLLTVFRLPGFIWFVFFLTSAVIINIIHQVPALHIARQAMSFITLALPVFCFMAIDIRENMMRLAVGLIIGFGLYFIFLVLCDGFNGEISRTLRGEQPTPIVAIALYILLKDRMSWLLKLTLLLVSFASFGIGIVVQARGPLLSLCLVPLLYFFCKFIPVKKIAIPLVLILGLMMHWGVGLWEEGGMYKEVLHSEHNTLSNKERAFLIDYSIDVLSRSPWTGMPFTDFGSNFGASFSAVDGYQSGSFGVLSPHNSFLEYAVFFGYPTAAMFMAFLYRLVQAGALANARRYMLLAVTISGILRLGAFYGFEGWLRIEWFALMFSIFYSYSYKKGGTSKLRPDTLPRYVGLRAST